MTEQKKTEIIKRWQYNKDHLFFFPHDDRTIKSYAKDKGIDAKSLFITAIALIVTSLIIGGLFGIATGKIILCIAGAFLFFSALFVMMSVLSFALYINYINGGDSTTYGTGMWVVTFFVMWYLLEDRVLSLYREYGIPAIVFLIIVSLYAVVWLIKKMFYEKENNLNVILMDEEDAEIQEEKRRSV